MKIGIDIDGVLTNMDSYMIDRGTKYFFGKNIFIKDASCYEIADVFGIDEETADDFWYSHIEEYFCNTDIKYGAKEAIDILKNNGNQIYIITSRSRQGTVITEEEAHEITKKWLKENEVYYDEIYFTEPGIGKRNVCEKLGIDIMIDDYVENILEVSKVSKCIIFDAMYNREFKETDNIKRCYSWYDLLHKINLFNKNI